MNDLVPVRQPSPAYEHVALAAFAALALTIVQPVAIGAAIAGTVLLVATRPFGSADGRVVVATRAAATALAAFLLVLGVAVGSLVSFTSLAILAPAVGVVAIAWGAPLERGVVRWLATGLLVLVVGIVTMIWIGGTSDPDIDVLALHVAAADAISHGENPYTEARAPDTSPLAEPGDEVVGYPYPPLTLVAYGGSELLLGDPRWAGAIALAVALGLVVRPWQDTDRRRSGSLIALGLAFAVQPQLGHLLHNGWTEPIALPLLAGVVLLWNRRPMAAAALLGCCFGLKQYWIVAVPLLLVWPDDLRWRRTGVALGVAAASLVPAFALDPEAAWQSLVVDLLEVPARADGISLTGLGWDLPLWLGVVASVAVALWMGRRGGNGSRFALALGATIGVTFLFGSQAFLNYWLLAGGLAIVGVAFSDRFQADPTPSVMFSSPASINDRWTDSPSPTG